MNAFQNIPAELRGLNQWVTWRYEQVEGDEKPTKVLYNPATGFPAKSTDRSTWVTFEQAVQSVPYGYAGIGFVLTKDDPYAFIDLDATGDDHEALEVQKRIFAAFKSYSEYSPSGQGLHIIVKGAVPRGSKRRFVEIYSDARFMTMTGNVFQNTPIMDYNQLLNLLWAQMQSGGNNGAPAYEGDAEEKQSDQDVLNMAASAVNGDKFMQLWRGDWTGYTPNQSNTHSSEADMALMNILAFYTRNRTQLARLFRMSGLGQRDKAKRDQYIKYMVDRSFDRLVPAIDFDAVRLSIEAAIAAKNAEAAQPPPIVGVQALQQKSIKTLEWPPGLLGQVAEHIYLNAARPVREVAIVAALGFASGVCGRAFNVSKQGLNQYILLLTGTGKGKEALHSGISRIMKFIADKHPSVWDFIGPSGIQSPEALLGHLGNRSPSFLSIVGEFGVRMGTLTSPNANASQKGLMGAFCDLYHKSGPNGRVGEIAYAEAKKNVIDTRSPAFSMIGDSVPENFYSELNNAMITSGLLPRFTIIEYHGDRMPLNPNVEAIDPDPAMIAALTAIVGGCQQMNLKNEPMDVGYTPEAKTLFDGFEAYTTDTINGSRNDLLANLWNRAHIKALKIAALIAVFDNPWQPIIDLTAANWAISLVAGDVNNLINRFSRGDIGVIETSDRRQTEEMQRVIREYFTATTDQLNSYHVDPTIRRMNFIPINYIKARCGTIEAFRKDRSGATSSINRTLTNMAEAGFLQDVPKADLERATGSRSRTIALLNPSYFGLGSVPKLV